MREGARQSWRELTAGASYKSGPGKAYQAAWKRVLREAPGDAEHVATIRPKYCLMREG